MEYHLDMHAPADTFHIEALSLRDLIFQPLPHRPEGATVILGHQGHEVVGISLPELRSLICQLATIISDKNLRRGDTVLLASFYSSNELANAILFSAFACMGIRVFIPIYPEVAEYKEWQALTGFKAVICPYKEIIRQKGHEREKEVIHSFSTCCKQQHIPLWDAYDDFSIPLLLLRIKEENLQPVDRSFLKEKIDTDTEAVIFTTSGTSGRSKLVVYNQGAFSLSCQSWQAAGMFDPSFCGNPGFTPLFTHTIGIRSFINALWTGCPCCIMVTDWFLHRPEEARYLLLQMQPGHIIGGPALFNMLLEFFRQYPELKTLLRKELKTLISIGAPYNPATGRAIRTALGLPLLNAFGTTETQMVLLNRGGADEDIDPEYLGTPLPGVSVRLEETGTEGVYELAVRAPYQSAHIIGERGKEAWFVTGDLVQYGPNGALRFAARKGTDFIKDDFGVKIPINLLRDYYPLLYQLADHVEWLPLDNKPGLAALLFVSPLLDHSAKEIAEWIKSRNEVLQSTIQPFEFSHRHLERFSLERGEPPTTRKGTFSRMAFLQRYEGIIRALKNPYAADPAIESVDAEERPLLYKFSNPRLSSLLEALKLDVTYERGEKDTLWYQRDGREVAVLDLVGGFGSGLLGHNHPAVKATIRKFLDSGRPAINTQGSQYRYPAILARELNRLFSGNTGKYFKVLFGNTGAEAVEIALHHAYMEWWTALEKWRDEQLQRYGSLQEINVAALWEENMQKAVEASAAVIVINNCFHGYTSGSRSLLNNKKQRSLFSGLLGPEPLHVNDREEDWKEQIEHYKEAACLSFNSIVKEEGAFVVKQHSVSRIIASLFEPVRGEGGICETNTGVADYLAGQTFPLIADEIQCGLGRTGSIPSYPGAAYYLLGKSLGGGYEKLSAVLIDDKRFKPSFPQYYNSTFANGEMAACAALTALEVIETEDYPGVALQKGLEFITKLEEVAARYPDIIQSIEGKGLMIGVQFNKAFTKDRILLRVLCENDLLGYMLAGWLFHNHNIRVLPSLSRSESIRIEPSVYITGEDMDTFCDALLTLCKLCREGRLYDLLRYLVNDDPYLDRPGKEIRGVFPAAIEEPAPGAVRVGFIGNFTAPPSELMLIEPDLQKASDTALRILFDKIQSLLDGKPLRLFSKNLMSGKVHFTFYILPFDTAHLEVIHRWGKKRFYIARIQEAVARLAAEGVSAISLGAHTSILSGNGLYLAEPKGVKILTGNTLTVASCLYHIEQYLGEMQRATDRPVTIAIIGAGGNIGTGLAGCFADAKYADVTLLLAGNNLKKLQQLRKKLFTPERAVLCTTDLFGLKKADIIISCTNTNDPLVFPHHIHPGKPVFIIDIAVPGSVSEEVKTTANVRFYTEASSVSLPADPEFVISTHTPVGKTFCCAAEVMLSAMYDVKEPLKGHVLPGSIGVMRELAEREGLFQNKVYAPPV